MFDPEKTRIKFSELAHSGVMGMKWGKRKRSGSVSVVKTGEKAKTPEKPKTSEKAKIPEKPKTVEKPKEAEKSKEEDSSNSLSDRKKNVDSVSKTQVKELTNSQLKSANERMQLEKTYSSLKGEQSTLARGQKRINTLVSVGTTLNSVYTLYNSPGGKAAMALVKRSITKTP